MQPLAGHFFWMVALLIVFNLLLSAFNAYCVLRLWRWRGDIAKLGRRLESWERWYRRCLPLVPLAAAERRLQVVLWRDRYQRWQERWQQGRQIFLLASLLLQVRGRARRR